MTRQFSLDTHAGQLQQAPWARQPGTDLFLGAHGARMHAHKLSCCFGGGKHEPEDWGTDVRHTGSGHFREVTVRVCTRCGHDVQGKPPKVADT